MSGTSDPAVSPATGRPREVLGLFHDRERLEGAAYKLQSAGFNRARLSVACDRDLDAVPDPGSRGALTTGTDRGNLRALGTGLAGAVAALAAAGITVMTGGAAAAAFGAAALAGGGAAAGLHALGDRQDPADEGNVILIARATTPELEAAATQALRDAGADKVWVQDAALPPA